VTLDGSGTSDPDGNGLSYEWITYPEAGTYEADIAITDPGNVTMTVAIPADAASTEVHILFVVHDNGAPPLAAYRRAVIRVHPD